MTTLPAIMVAFLSLTSNSSTVSIGLVSNFQFHFNSVMTPSVVEVQGLPWIPPFHSDDHFPASPTLRYQLPSLSIDDEFD